MLFLECNDCPGPDTCSMQTWYDDETDIPDVPKKCPYSGAKANWVKIEPGNEEIP